MSKRKTDLRALWFAAFSAGFWAGFAIAALADYPASWDLGGLLLLAAFGRAPQQAALAQGQPQYQHLITVDANGFDRQNKVAEVALNFTPLIADAGGSGALDPNSIRVHEINAGGDVIRT